VPLVNVIGDLNEVCDCPRREAELHRRSGGKRPQPRHPLRIGGVLLAPGFPGHPTGARDLFPRARCLCPPKTTLPARFRPEHPPAVGAPFQTLFAITWSYEKI